MRLAGPKKAFLLRCKNPSDEGNKNLELFDGLRQLNYLMISGNSGLLKNSWLRTKQEILRSISLAISKTDIGVRKATDQITILYSNSLSPSCDLVETLRMESPAGKGNFYSCRKFK